jgi:adenylate cyclase
VFAAMPRTDWFSAEVDCDPYGSLGTGAKPAFCAVVGSGIDPFPATHRTDVPRSARATTRIGLTATILAVPLLGLTLLLRRPALDLRWENHPAHFWLVLSTAVFAAILAYATAEAAVRRGDARLLYVSLTFLSSAGFLALHALATPGVLLGRSNVGFAIATPVGVGIGSVFAALSTRELSGDSAVRNVRVGERLRLALLGLMIVWGAWSLASLPPLNRPPQLAEGLPLWLAVPAVLLYAGSAVRYVKMWLRRPSVLLLAVPSAFILLAESMIAIAFARNWRLSWWEWHVLLLVAFGLVTLSARASWREERFAELYLPQTSAGSRDISVLFADLQGFTSFSESRPPDEVTKMLNEYFAVAVPAVKTLYAGEIDRIIGDALMVTFNKRGDQPDHAQRAAGAGLALQKATARLAEEHPDWPRFRVGINSGPVTVSLLGTEGGRTHTVVGDTVNIASRIEGAAPAGGVAIGPDTKALLPDAVTVPLGQMQLKGKREPLPVYLLTSLHRIHESGSG